MYQQPFEPILIHRSTLHLVALSLAMLISCSAPRPDDDVPHTHDKDTIPVVPVESDTLQVPVRREHISIEKASDDGHRFRFAMARMPFDAQRHDMTRIGQCEIDGERLFGTDCDPPRYELKSMTLAIDGRVVSIPRQIYQQFYEPNLGYADGTSYVDAFLSTERDAVFVMMNGGDGAGAYSVCWCLRRDGQHSKMVTHDEVYFEFINGPE